jgi:hypothetical protein
VPSCAFDPAERALAKAFDGDGLSQRARLMSAMIIGAIEVRPARENAKGMSWPEVTVKAAAIPTRSPSARRQTEDARWSPPRARGPRAPASTCLRLRRSARSLDLYEYVTQLTASGPSKSRQRARSPALPASSNAAVAAPAPVAPTACAECARQRRSPALPQLLFHGISPIANQWRRGRPRAKPQARSGRLQRWARPGQSDRRCSIGSQRSSVARSCSMLTGFTR